MKVFLLDNSVSPDFFLNNGVGMHQLMHGKHIQCILVHQEKGRLRITELYRTELWELERNSRNHQLQPPYKADSYSKLHR